MSEKQKAPFSGPQPAPAAFVYMVRCADGTLYTGWTNRLERRVEAHNRGKGAKYTRPRLPVKLVYAEACADKRHALRRERQIKGLSRCRKEELLQTAAVSTETALPLCAFAPKSE